MPGSIVRPGHSSSPATGSAPSHPEPAAPELAYTGRTPFVAYTEADVLRELIHVRTDEPLETTFVVTTQIMELHFALLRHEWNTAIVALDADDAASAVAALRRSVTVQDSLIAAWGMLDPLSPVQYNRFREALGSASGFQSFGYRELEFLLGVKDERMLRPHAEMPKVAAELGAIFRAPSLYERAVALLARRGFDIPAAVLERDPSQAWTEAVPEVVEAWRRVYSGDLPVRGLSVADSGSGSAAPDDTGRHEPAEVSEQAQGAELAALAEALITVSERHSRWRFVHYTAVRRILGAKPGTAGSAGLTWLKRAVDQVLFVELWEVRGVL